MNYLGIDLGGTNIYAACQKANEMLSKSEVEAIRKAVKNHLVNYGAITTMTGGNHSKFYNGSSVFGSTAYNCNDTSKTRDHAVTIVGWDDNYSRNNFADGTKPSRDGAYIVLNSYGNEAFSSLRTKSSSWANTLICSQIRSPKNATPNNKKINILFLNI